MFIRKKMEQWIKLPRINLFILHFCLLVVSVSNTQVKDVLTLHQLLPYDNNNQWRVSSSVAANKQFNSNDYHSYKNDHLTSYSGYQAVNLHPTAPRNVKRDAKIKRQISNDKFAYNNNRGNLLIKGKKGFKPTAFKSYKVPSSSSKTKLKDKSFRLRGNLFRNNVRTTKRPDKDDEIESQIVQRSNRDHNLNFDKHWKNAQGGPSQIADHHHHLPTSLIFNRNHHHHQIESTGIPKESRINGREKSRNNLSYLFSEPFAKRSEYARDANVRNDGNSHRYFSRSPRQRYPLNFKDRNKYKTAYRPPHDYRKSYNDNLIKTIKKKYEKILPVVKNIRQSNYYYYDDDSNGQLLREDEIVSSPFLSLNEANRLKKHDYGENYNNKKLQSITNSKIRNYGDKKFKTLRMNGPSTSNDISHKGSNTRTFPDRSVSYNGFYNPQRRLAYNHYGVIDRIKTALGSVWNFLLSPGTYKYYAEKRYQPDDLSDYYGTFDDDYYYDYYDETNQKGILERFSDIQGAPTTAAAAVTAAILPGSLIAIGASLAYYYFNYVWYPTPIVTARLSELIEKFTGREIRSGEESINKSHVVEVLKRIEEDYSRKNAESSSCRNRFVCQIHQEFKEQLEFWGIFVRLFKTDSFSDENTTIFSTPRRFTSESDCESNFSTCKAPFIPLRSILDVFFNQNHKENEIGNYMNT